MTDNAVHERALHLCVNTPGGVALKACLRHDAPTIRRRRNPCLAHPNRGSVRSVSRSAGCGQGLWVGNKFLLARGSRHRAACSRHRQVRAQGQDIYQHRLHPRSKAGSVHLSLDEISATENPACRQFHSLRRSAKFRWL